MSALPRGAIIPLLAALLAGPAAAQESAVQLTRTLQVGGDDAPPEHTLVRPADLAVGRDGTIYLLDAGDAQVKVYDARGRFVRTIGRRGGGPGEFQRPTSIQADSTLRVSDALHQRVTTFTFDGRVLGTERLPSPPGRVLSEISRLRHGWSVGVLVAQYSVHVDSGARAAMRQVLLTTPPRGEPDTLFSFRSGGASWHPRDALVPAGIAPTHLGEGGAHAVSGDSLLAVADGYTGAVRWYRVEPGRIALVRTRQLPSRSRPATESDVRMIERRLRREPGGASLPRRLVFGAPPRLSIASRAVFAHDGALWIRNTSDDEQPHVWTVYGRDGTESIRLRLPRGFALAAVRGQDLYGFASTENDAPLLHVYRMTVSR